MCKIDNPATDNLPAHAVTKNLSSRVDLDFSFLSNFHHKWVLFMTVVVKMKSNIFLKQVMKSNVT